MDYKFDIFDTIVEFRPQVTHGGNPYAYNVFIGGKDTKIELAAGALDPMVKILSKTVEKKKKKLRSYETDFIKLSAIYYIFKILDSMQMSGSSLKGWRYRMIVNSSCNTLSMIDDHSGLHFYLYIGANENCKISTLIDGKMKYYPAKKNININYIFEKKLDGIVSMQKHLIDANRFTRTLKYKREWKLQEK